MRVIVIILDGVGCGELPDAESFGDSGSNTLANLSQAVNGLALPNLGRLGLGDIVPIKGVAPAPEPLACFGRMAEASPGKDSTTGHWELAGLVLDRPFPVFHHGFPKELMQRFEAAIGRKSLGNVRASGTEVIQKLGAKHLRTGSPIVYTSADSVFQVAAHEEVIPVSELYSICRKARVLLTGPCRVARVIARPFTGKPGRFVRTSRRRDFSCPPPGPTLLDNVKDAGMAVTAIGKVDDLFAGQGFTASHHSVRNAECVEFIIKAMEDTGAGLIFANLVQFDMDWGHRNDTAGLARGLSQFDAQVPRITGQLRPGDLLFITADHGNDPTTASTDHSREYVPLLALGPGIREGVRLGTRASFADLGQTAAEFLGVKPTAQGASFLASISRGAT